MKILNKIYIKGEWIASGSASYLDMNNLMGMSVSLSNKIHGETIPQLIEETIKA